LFARAASPVKRLDRIPDGTHAEYIYRSFRKETAQRFKEWFGQTL
jgi:hypothetical protein